jgi:hypothetical protein
MSWLTLMVLAAVDGGVVDAPVTGLDPFDPLYSSCPVAPPAVVIDTLNRVGIATEIASGSFNGFTLMSPARSARVACLMDTCGEALKGERKVTEQPPYWWLVLGSALSIGIALGVMARGLWP